MGIPTSRRHSARDLVFRGVAAMLVLATVTATTRSIAAPGDIFTSPAPVAGAEPPKATHR